ncbi:MAG: SMC-Scp complex subunit ScpB [Saprospiraceae bacterium]|nr:SMC-Scp complex subunit ScpB [Saprospiraceae bacterium]MBL0023597.1 SMC-Scp complex subunit ScpB [Saprospiraceae bacterium]
MDKLSLHIESLIFAADSSISFDDIKQALEESLGQVFSDDQIADCIGELMEKYATDDYSIEIMEMAGGFRFMSKGAYHNTIGTFLKQNTNKKLSKPALETLSIIAYKQPVTKTEVEAIRGVNSDYSIQKLLEKNLIEISGRSDGPGRPLLYITTSRFTDYFGLKSVQDLPKPKEIESVENQIGEPAPIESEHKPQHTVGDNEEE